MLLHSYRTSAGWDLLHADVWRLEQLQEVIDLAIPELLEEGAAAVIEWGELAAPALAPDYLHVAVDFEPGDFEPGDLEAGGGENGANGARRLVFSALGPARQGRMAELSTALAALR